MNEKEHMEIGNVLLCSLLISSTFFVNSIEKRMITAKQYQRSSQFALLDPNYDRTKIVVNAVIDDKPTRYISFITDNENNHYVIKQRRKGTVKEQFLSVFEKLSAHIAEVVNIPAHKVQILPAEMDFPGKMIVEEVATILTFVPGISIKFIKTGPYKGISIRQTNNPVLPQEELGLTENVITNMSLHPDLASIVALDTFICNDDRHTTNCFYDEQTNHFYAIDMDKIYNIKDDSRDLISKLACDQIRRMICAKKKFSQRELYGLRVYKETLQQLVILLPPGYVCTLLDEFAILGGFNKKIYVEEVAYLATRTKKKIEQSYTHILELISVLAELIK